MEGRARPPRHRPPGPRRVLRLGRAAAPPGAARKARHRVRQRPARRRDHRHLRGAGASASAARCPPRGRCGCAPRPSSSRPISRPTGRPPGRGLGHRAQAPHSGGRAGRPRRGLPRRLRARGAEEAAGAAAGSCRRSGAATGLGTASIGIGPNKLVAKVASDAEKPAGFVALSREGACERFAGASPGLIPGIGPKTVERLGRFSASRRSAPCSRPTRGVPGRPLRGETNFGRDLRRRAHFHGATTLTLEHVAVSGESRGNETTFDVDIDDAPELEARLTELARQLCERLQGRPSGAAARSRSRSASTTGRR